MHKTILNKICKTCYGKYISFDSMQRGLLLTIPDWQDVFSITIKNCH